MSGQRWIVFDGCHSGWIGCQIHQGKIMFQYIETVGANLSSQFDTIFIDCPVYLPQVVDHYPRVSDIRAKQQLGKFHASIFYAPVQSWLSQSYANVNQVCDFHQKPKMSKQSYNCFAKIKEITNLPAKVRKKCIEIHPELIIHSFLGNSKRSKKTNEGKVQRLAFIQSQFKFDFSINDCLVQRQRLQSSHPSCQCSIDDLIDALFVACFCDHLLMKMKSHDVSLIRSHELLSFFSFD